jgi:hypothetical protein
MGNPQPSFTYLRIYHNRCTVGKTNKRHGANGRWSRHVSKSLTSKQYFSEDTIWAAIKKHGVDSFNIKVLETCDIEKLCEREAYYIEYHNTLHPNGYNILNAKQRIFSEKIWNADQRLNISEIHKETMKNLPMYMVYIKARPDLYQSEGYAILNHPKSRAKYFTSKKLSMNTKYNMAIEYLKNLNL